MMRMFDNRDLYRWPPLKAWMLAACFMAMAIAPETTLHLLAVTAHTGYEGLAFVLETLLIDAFQLSKFQAQMVVFYSSCLVGILLCYRFVRWLPIWLRRLQQNIRLGFRALHDKLRARWASISVWKKIELLMVQFAFLAGSLGLMLA